MSRILIGPAGWSYEDWKGKVYPDPAPRDFDPLVYLARLFPCIEVNSTFYRPPVPRMSEAWARRTPDSFVFTVKAWERFSHDREPLTSADARVFQEGVAPLLQAGKLGALLLQFPWFFKDTPEARDRIRRAADALGEWAPLVIELRHRSWLDALDFLREQRLSFCNIDQPTTRDLASGKPPQNSAAASREAGQSRAVDQPRSSTSITGTRHVTGPVGYVRFHGRNAKAWFSKEAGRDQKYDYLYSLKELQEWDEALRSMEADPVFVILNNHFEGKAVVNALQLMKALGENPIVPDPIKAAYPDAFLTPKEQS